MPLYEWMSTCGPPIMKFRRKKLILACREEESTEKKSQDMSGKPTILILIFTLVYGYGIIIFLVYHFRSSRRHRSPSRSRDEERSSRKEKLKPIDQDISRESKTP